MLWLTHYIIFTQTTQLAATPSPAVPVDSIVFVGSFRLILYTNSLRQNRNRNRNRNQYSTRTATDGTAAAAAVFPTAVLSATAVAAALYSLCQSELIGAIQMSSKKVL